MMATTRSHAQGLLFKVNGVSVTAPVYTFLSAAMLMLCAGFLTWWLANIVVSVTLGLAAAAAGHALAGLL